jgi:hypothetical protein
MPIYTPSSGDAVNFTLQVYVVPSGDAVNFNLSEVRTDQFFQMF